MTDLRAPEETTMRVQGLPTPETRWSVQCLNCQAPLTGQFCSNCGQRAVPPHPNLRELAGDAFSEFVGWDGKFAETIRLLMLKPGELTRQWLGGRRAHFISPLRLYLTASVLFFIVQAAVPQSSNRAGVLEVGDTRTSPGRVSAATAKAIEGKKPLTQAEKDSALAAVEKAPAILRPLMRRAIQDPNGLKATMRSLIPRMFFALLPLYAGILALFYRRRNYPEHLYFAIHLHAFVFLALLLSEITKFSRSNKVSSLAAVISLTWIAVYSLIALRRVYGGSRLGTFFRGVGIMTFYTFVALPVMLITVYIAALL